MLESGWFHKGTRRLRGVTWGREEERCPGDESAVLPPAVGYELRTASLLLCSVLITHLYREVQIMRV